MIEKLSDEVFNSLSSDVKKYILQLESSNLSMGQQNNLLNKNYKGLKNKMEIIKEINFIYKTREIKHNNVHFYEEGKIEAFLWVLGLPENISDADLKVLIKDV